MNTDKKNEHQGLDVLTEQILGAAFEVSNTLGAGFLEKVYERALLRELELRGLTAVSQGSFPVNYKGQCVGEYCGDILVEDTLVLELKCTERLSKEHSARCLNYLQASGKSLCLLINFQNPNVEWKRLALEYQPQPS